MGGEVHLSHPGAGRRDVFGRKTLCASWLQQQKTQLQGEEMISIRISFEDHLCYKLNYYSSFDWSQKFQPIRAHFILGLVQTVSPKINLTPQTLPFFKCQDMYFKYIYIHCVIKTPSELL